MVSTNSSPPIAMPVHVPAGHVVQQIVDENGTLRDMIISTQHSPGVVPLSTHGPQHYGAGSTNGTNPSQSTFYQSVPTGYVPSTHYHSNIQPTHPIQTTRLGHFPPPPQSLPSLTNTLNQTTTTTTTTTTSSPSPPTTGTFYKDERTQKQHNKLKKKIYDKQQQQQLQQQQLQQQQQQVHQQQQQAQQQQTMKKSENNTILNRNNELLKGLNRNIDDKGMDSVGTSEDGEESSSIVDEDDSVQIIFDILSSVQAPKVSELSSRSALLLWGPPTRLSQNRSTNNDDNNCSDDIIDINENDIRYEVLLSDKSKEMKFKSIYNGASLSCRIQDLRPGQEYSICLQAHYEELQGSATDPVKFLTPPCEPDKPQPPKLHQRLKNSLQLKWNSCNDNGSNIINYILEYDDSNNNNNNNKNEFKEFYIGKLKQYTIQKLEPGHCYKFRLCAINEIGKSPYSDIVTYYTLNNPPQKPKPPYLIEKTINSLHLKWEKRINDNEFTLQYCDPITKYFLPIYNGYDTNYICNGLKKFTEYKFRLRAENDGGQSQWSDDIIYCTLPDRPSRPSKPIVKGRINAHSFRLKWEPPLDNGGAQIIEYILELNSGSGYRTIYNGNDIEAKCDKLTPGTTYQLRVSCLSSGGTSNFSDPCTVTTDAINPGQCSMPKYIGKPKSNSIMLKWLEPDYNGGAPILEYEIEMLKSKFINKKTDEFLLNNDNNVVVVDNDNNINDNDDDIDVDNGNIVYKNKQCECLITNLQPGCLYGYRVRAINRIGPGLWSDILKVTSGAAPPNQPEQPLIICKSPFHLYIEWKQPITNGAPILEYNLELSIINDVINNNNNNGDGINEIEHFRTIYNGLDTYYDLKGLNPFTLYTIRLQATNSAGTSPYSLKTTIKTPPAPPSTITTIDSHTTPVSIKLNWLEPLNNGSPILYYNIEIGDKLIKTINSINEYIFDNLESNTLYRIRIQACNHVGLGNFSSVFKIMTLRPPPNPPYLDCVNYGSNYLKLKWGEGRNIDYIQYCLEMENNRSHEYQCIYKGTSLSYKVNRLNEETIYKFRINASNDAGIGDYSKIYEFKTTIALPASLKPPKIIELDNKYCTIEWIPVKNQFTDSIINQLQITKIKDPTYKKFYKTTDNKIIIDNLDPGVEYSAKVCAIRLSSSGELTGPYSSTIQFTTPSLEPIIHSKHQLTTALTTSQSHHHHHHHHHQHKKLNTILYYTNKLHILLRAKTISDQPIFLAILITIIGIFIAILIMAFL